MFLKIIYILVVRYGKFKLKLSWKFVFCWLVSNYSVGRYYISCSERVGISYFIKVRILWYGCGVISFFVIIFEDCFIRGNFYLVLLIRLDFIDEEVLGFIGK